MEETITFWLDNKTCSGFRVAAIDNQTLVSYRDKYFIVISGSAQMKGIKPLHYSKSSMPPIWKKALKGILPTDEKPTTPAASSDDDFLPIAASLKKERPAMQKSILTTQETFDNQTDTAKTSTVASKKPAGSKPSNEPKPVRVAQATVTTICPCCSHKQELPFEKGKNGKPFFTNCLKCSTEFAVRFVPVTVYQAQVAAFR